MKCLPVQFERAFSASRSKTKIILQTRGVRASTGFDWLMTGSNRRHLKHENTRSRSVHDTALLYQLSNYCLLLKERSQSTSLIIVHHHTQRHATYMLYPPTVTEIELRHFLSLWVPNNYLCKPQWCILYPKYYFSFRSILRPSSLVHPMMHHIADFASLRVSLSRWLYAISEDIRFLLQYLKINYMIIPAVILRRSCCCHTICNSIRQ